MGFIDYLKSFQDVLTQTVATQNGQEVSLDKSFNELFDYFNSIRETQEVFLVGNGGSSGIASHSAVDFVNACGFKAQAITDNSMLTCMANDYGYENVYAQPLKMLFKEGDALIAISSSGNSQNIVNACQHARTKGATIVTFSGFSADNKLRKEGDFNFWLDSKDYGQVEIGHALLLHYLTDNISIK